MSYSAPFKIEETHGILNRIGQRNRCCSERLGWASLYASAQKELPFEGHFLSVKDQLLVLHVDGPVHIHSFYGASLDQSTAPAGSVHLVPGGVDFGVRLMAELTTVHVYLRRSIIEEVAAELTIGDPASIEIPPQLVAEDASLVAMMGTIGMALEENDYGTVTYIDYLARALAAQLISRHSGAISKASAQSGNIGGPTPLINRAVAFMRANIDMAVSLECIAQAANCSPSHLIRQFRISLGMPPHQYLMMMRIRHAQHLLATTCGPIAQIAFECGFSHQEHLTRMFRRALDTTPGAYRRAMLN